MVGIFLILSTITIIIILVIVYRKDAAFLLFNRVIQEEKQKAFLEGYDIKARGDLFIEMLNKGYEVFGDEKKFWTWFFTPHVALGEKTPVGMLATTEGIQEIIDELGRIEHGVL